MPGFHIRPLASGEAWNCDDALNSGGPPGGDLAYSSAYHTVETGRRHRFLLELMSVNGSPIFGTGSQGLLVYGYKCTRPSPEFDEVVIHNAQDEIYRPGKNRWKPIDFTFYEVFKQRDYAPGDNVAGRDKDLAAELIYQWWAKVMINLSTSTHNNLSDYMAYGMLSMLDGFGNIVWEYNLLDCWPLKVTPSDLDFSDSSIADITLTLRFQKAWERQPVLAGRGR
jgi:hypothetical protein